MSIYRIRKRDNPFVQIDKTMIHDSRLSFKAKGILTYLLSRPDDWQVYEVEIIKHAKDGRDSVRSGIKELIECGYIERTEKRNDKGQFKGYEYTVYEVSDRVGKTVLGKSNIGESNTTNNDLNNKEITNKDKRYTITSNGDYVFNYFSFKYKNHYNKEHPTITYEQLNRLKDTINLFRDEYNIGDGEWEFAVDEHFKMLKRNKSNNGNILGFINGDDMQGSLVRYLEVK